MFRKIHCIRIPTICTSDHPADLTPGNMFAQTRPFQQLLRSLCVSPGSSIYIT